MSAEVFIDYPGEEPSSDKTTEDFVVRLRAALSEFSEDVISYRTDDLERYGMPGDRSVTIRSPRRWGTVILRSIEL